MSKIRPKKRFCGKKEKRERETFYANGWSKNLANLHKMSSSQISIIKQLIRDPFCRLEISQRRHFCRSPSSAAKIKLIFCTPLNDIFSGRTCETNKQDKKWSSRSKLFLQKSEKLENYEKIMVEDVCLDITTFGAGFGACHLNLWIFI